MHKKEALHFLQENRTEYVSGEALTKDSILSFLPSL